MPTITPTNGYSPAAQALAANQKTLATMGPLPAGQQQVADAAVSSGSAAADTLAQAPQTLQQAGQTLSGQAGLGQSADSMMMFLSNISSFCMTCSFLAVSHQEQRLLRQQ